MEVEKTIETEKKFNFPKFKRNTEKFLAIWLGLVLLGVLVVSIVIAINTEEQIYTIWVDLFKELIHSHPISVLTFFAGAGLFGGLVWLVLFED